MLLHCPATGSTALPFLPQAAVITVPATQWGSTASISLRKAAPTPISASGTYTIKMKIYAWLTECAPQNLVLGQTSLRTPPPASPFGLPCGCVREGCRCLSEVTEPDDVNFQPTADAFTSKFWSEGLESFANSLPLLSGILEPHNSSL